MTIEEFWNQAFLASLARLPVEEAKTEADKATEACVIHWQSHIYHNSSARPARWQDQSIGNVPRMWPAVESAPSSSV